ncbi:RND family efflux transporter MFP subunit [Rhizobium subbaraonis]|uniref:RND family efflux transporter MFP subunit n=1 Tax=Rhizobium subbaraonis TaxID=908946 RepID=A0A285UZD8_9HYPH|nr:efflux RND transporter periplasmic adaptor subunit [Rhizobium subbaraonis]SOC47027.1 RND family efflux transporter MFP subunit [Rhizobium subbaraonis]
MQHARSLPCAALPLLLSVTLLVGCDQRSIAAQAESPRPVKSVTATAEPEALASLPGVVRARIETDLAFRTLGRMVSRKVDAGDLVHKGDVVAKIDPLSLQLAVTSAEANLRDAQAQLTNAVTTERRKRTLASKNVGSVADHELAEQQLRSAEANVAKATASVAKAREQLGYAELLAEFDGVVTATFGEMGQTVAAGEPVLRLARIEQRDVVVDVPEAQFRSVHLGDRYSIALQLDRRVRTLGVVREISPQADPSTRTHRLKIAMEPAPEVFRLGAVVTATPLVEGAKRAIALPSSAVSDKDRADRVWIVDPSTGTVTARSVLFDNRVAGSRSVRVLSGLREGEQVVVAGVNELTDGQKVKVEQELRP